MPFPPGDMVAAFGRWLHFERLKQMLTDRHPELEPRIYLPPTEPLYLKVNTSGTSGVALGLVTFGNVAEWTIIDPSSAEKTVWPGRTPDEVLVDALHARAEAVLTGQPERSPWRWGESVRSTLTDLADLLSEKHVHVQRVVVHNRLFVVETRRGPRTRTVGTEEGCLLEASMGGWGRHEFDWPLGAVTVRVSIKPTLGWVIDVHDESGWRRLDLDDTLWLETPATPGTAVSALALEKVAEALFDGPDTWVSNERWAPPARPRTLGAVAEQAALFHDVPDLPTQQTLPQPNESVDVIPGVACQLRMYGFVDVEKGDRDNPLDSPTYHIEWHDRVKDLSTTELQRLNGLAAASGEDLPKRLILITTAGITKPAAVFADRAKAFVFHVDRSTSRLTGLNSRAREAGLPASPPWGGVE